MDQIGESPGMLTSVSGRRYVISPAPAAEAAHAARRAVEAIKEHVGRQQNVAGGTAMRIWLGPARSRLTKQTHQSAGSTQQLFELRREIGLLVAVLHDDRRADGQAPFATRARRDRARAGDDDGGFGDLQRRVAGPAVD